MVVAEGERAAQRAPVGLEIRGCGFDAARHVLPRALLCAALMAAWQALPVPSPSHPSQPRRLCNSLACLQRAGAGGIVDVGPCGESGEHGQLPLSGSPASSQDTEW